MSRTAPSSVLFGLIFLPALAVAAVAEPSGDASGRFTMSPVDGGFLRLDKQTGAVSMCAKSGGDWACKPVADPADNPAGELSQLETENRSLKDRVKKLEDLLETQSPGAPLPDLPSAGPNSGAGQLPSEEEVDQALDYISRVYKKIRDHVRDLDKPLPPGEHTAPPVTPPGPPDAPPPSNRPL